MPKCLFFFVCVCMEVLDPCIFEHLGRHLDSSWFLLGLRLVLLYFVHKQSMCLLDVPIKLAVVFKFSFIWYVLENNVDK